MGFEDKLTAPKSDGGQLFFITGAPGTGKTTLVSTITEFDSGKLLILDCGGGMRAIADHADIATRSVDRWSVMKEASEYLSKKDCPFKWVAIDLVPEVYGVCLAEVVAEGSSTKSGRPTLEARGIANDRFVSMIRDYRVLSEKTGIHVIFTSHTTETKDDDNGMILVRANLTPGTLSTVLGIVDVAAYLEMKKSKRSLLLVGNERVWAKTRKPLSYGAVTERIEDPSFTKIMKELQAS